MTRILNIICLTAVLALLIPHQTASALIVFDPSNYKENLLSALRAMEQIQNQVKQLANEALMIARMDQDLLKLDVSIVSELQEHLKQIDSLLQKGEGIAFDIQHSEEMFKTLYPKDYKDALSYDADLKRTKDRWEAKLAAYKKTISLQAQIAEISRDDQATLNRLLDQSHRAEGNLQAQQAGNELLGLGVKQLMQLQAILIAQGRAQSLEGAERSAEEEQSRAHWDSFLGRTGTGQ